MTEPVLFLDFDGVLNSTDWYQRRTHRGSLPYDEIDPLAVQRLNRIVAETGCKIVVSSTWRLLYSLDQFKAMLMLVGDERLPLIDCTPDGATKEHGPLWAACQRGTEIQMWREANNHDGPYAVLDDDTDMDDVVDHFVQTQFATGLLDEHVEEAIALLTPPAPE